MLFWQKTSLGKAMTCSTRCAVGQCGNASRRPRKTRALSWPSTR